MGCNAWNHPSNCNCGWGGDTGGGGRPAFGAASMMRAIRIPDGLDWSRGRMPRYESYVNPNARCPVCGADVFFYQSPHGGRVFFDPPLGPPWPKHPCTDSYVSRGARDPVLPPLRVYERPRQDRFDPTKWQPFIPKRVEEGPSMDRVYIDREETGLLGLFVPVPHLRIGGAPVRWRRHPNDPGLIELSTIDADSNGTLTEHRQAIPTGLQPMRTWIGIFRVEH
jgi:hypothetical protein